jgi:gamma-glutamylcyclotransferase
MPDDTHMRGIKPTLYFGYGSNIWIEQMNRRCPNNKYIGLGVLREW